MDYTQNGALTFASSGNAWVDLYFKLTDGVSDETMNLLLEASRREGLRETLVILFDLRNCRGGKGRYSLFTRAFHKLFSNEECFSICLNQLKHIPHYGSYKDFKRLWKLTTNDDLKNNIVNLYAQRLEEDCFEAKSMSVSEYASFVKKNDRVPNQGDFSISLAAKYAPKRGDFACMLRRKLHLTEKEYRWLTSDLRTCLNIVEIPLSAQKISEIDYEKVPGVAFKKYLSTFREKDTERFLEFMNRARQGEVRLHVDQVYPHSFVNSIRNGFNVEENSTLFDVYLNDYGGLFENAVVICDTSGSMQSGPGNVAPLDVALALTLLISWNTRGEFNRSFIEFSSESRRVSIAGENWKERIDNISTSNWGDSTNIQAAYDLLLESEVDLNAVYCISDMQFDCCGSSTTNFEEIKSKFRARNKPFPTFIFWNVAGIAKDCPVTCQEEGVILISGYSPSVCKMIYECTGNITPLTFIETIISSTKYERIQIDNNEKEDEEEEGDEDEKEEEDLPSECICM